MKTIIERDKETTQTLIIKFAHALCTSCNVTKRTACNQIITLYKNNAEYADVVKIARAELAKLAR